MAGGLRFNFQKGAEIISALRPTHCLAQWILDTNHLVNEADHSPPSSANIKNVWGYTTTFIQATLLLILYVLFISMECTWIFILQLCGPQNQPGWYRAEKRRGGNLLIYCKHHHLSPQFTYGYPAIVVVVQKSFNKLQLGHSECIKQKFIPLLAQYYRTLVHSELKLIGIAERILAISKGILILGTFISGQLLQYLV
jgi:hypothetical protein